MMRMKEDTEGSVISALCPPPSTSDPVNSLVLLSQLESHCG